jgi:hypothetical protein
MALSGRLRHDWTVNHEPIETARRKFFQVFEKIILLLGIVDIKKAIINTVHSDDRLHPPRSPDDLVRAKIEAGSLPEELPAMQGAGQCTPERITADEDMLASIAQVTDWRWENDAIVLTGPATMKFRPATN